RTVLTLNGSLAAVLFTSDNTVSLHVALPLCSRRAGACDGPCGWKPRRRGSQHQRRIARGRSRCGDGRARRRGRKVEGRAFLHILDRKSTRMNSSQVKTPDDESSLKKQNDN